METLFLSFLSFLISGWTFVNTWPINCTDGALTINGTTTHLAAGSVKKYSSISITNSGILQIDGGNAWTIIGNCGAFTLSTSGKILINDGTNIGGTFTATVPTPDNTALSFTVATTVGGQGGDSDPGVAGQPSSGNGGGGAGSGDAQDANSTDGGNGSDGFPIAAGGAGAHIYGNSGTNGANGLDTGGGGGGGSSGQNGSALYLKIAGAVTDDGSGLISCRGSAGGNGGTGGNGTANFGAGGGGGGGGGNGGKCIVKTRVGQTISSTVSATAGTAGTGGAMGIGGGSNGNNGTAGTNGSNGTTSVTNY